MALSSYAIQLLSWGMGDAMARWLPTRQYYTFGYKWSLNPGRWNAKEHALIVVAYWGSCYTAYGLGPLSALKMYYKKDIGIGTSFSFQPMAHVRVLERKKERRDVREERE